MNMLDQVTANLAPSAYFEKENPLPANTKASIRLIAYYLPQYHPIPENNLWWGPGFTEWTNVTKAVPRFKGHYQPHLPGELGFYDLRLPQILQRQAELARSHGLAGLCFHHYWFNGKRLLDSPIQLLLKHKEIDIPFCVNWANESWSRRWEGKNEEVMIKQSHSSKDDLAFAASLEPLFRDSRYIRINNRPLLMLYRPKILPNAAATVRRWRSYFESLGLGNPYIVMPQCFGDVDPRPYGMDAAAGFPPHHSGFNAPEIQDTVVRLDPNYDGRVVQFADMAAAALANIPTDFRYFPGVCPSWDNEARRPRAGFCVLGSTPAEYGRWLATACQQVLSYPDPDERIVFINAWNEWAEGAHLEPDRHFGYAYLAETARVIASLVSSKPAIVHSPMPQTSASPKRRPVRALPGLIVKNLAHHAANAAEATAHLLRKFT